MNYLRLIMVLSVLLVGGVAGIALDRLFLAPVEHHETALEHAQKHLDPNYVCPMHSEIMSDQPGSCPICGMDLVKVATTVLPDEAQNGMSVVRISPIVRHNFGIRTAQVLPRTLSKRAISPGFVSSIKSGKRKDIATPITGKVTFISVKAQKTVSKGDLLFTMVSQLAEDAQAAHLQLLAEQAVEPIAVQKVAKVSINGTLAVEETEAVATKVVTSETVRIDDDIQLDKNTAIPDPVAVSRASLKLIGLTQKQITNLEKSGEILTEFKAFAPLDGTVIPLAIESGGVYKSGHPAMAMQGNARVTVVANAVQRDIAWIENGYPAELFLPHAPGHRWQGNVTQKAVSGSVRNVSVRYAFNVPQYLVHSAMYVKAIVVGDRRENILSVPREAVIHTETNTRVVKRLDNGSFQPVIVKIGAESDDFIEVISGVEQGDTVVTSGQFLLDSESSLKASFHRMGEVDNTPEQPPSMSH